MRSERGLTPKQEAFVRELAISKLSALRQLARHLGMIDSPWEPSESEKAERYEKHQGIACWATAVLAADWTGPIAKEASALILDYVLPDWRKGAHPSWLGPVVGRNDRAVQVWRKEVLSRDGHRCATCGSQSALHAHHLVRWADAPRLRITVENGVTLCAPCHRRVHGTEGH